MIAIATMNITTRAGSIGIQNGDNIHIQDHSATGWTAQSFKTIRTIPIVPRQPKPFEVACLFDIILTFQV